MSGVVQEQYVYAWEEPVNQEIDWVQVTEDIQEDRYQRTMSNLPLELKLKINPDYKPTAEDLVRAPLNPNRNYVQDCYKY